MELQWPLILFTTLVAWSAGLFGTQALMAVFGVGKKAQVPAWVCSAVLLAAGGIAVFFHLEHWERIFNGFGHLTSGITQELIAIVVLAVVAVAYLVLMRKSDDGASVPKWLAWLSVALSVALVAVMAVLCLPSSGMAHGFPVASGMLAAATVLVGLPDLLSSASHRVAELEYACRFDCRAVALARLVVLGCADVVTVTAIALAAPVMLGTDLFASLMHACAPYFLSCAGALLLVRRCAPSQALPLACAWTLLVAAGAYALFTLVPPAYAQGSAWAWALVAAGSLVWAFREARAWLGGIAGGLDMLAAAANQR